MNREFPESIDPFADIGVERTIIRPTLGLRNSVIHKPDIENVFESLARIFSLPYQLGENEKECARPLLRAGVIIQNNEFKDVNKLKTVLSGELDKFELQLKRLERNNLDIKAAKYILCTYLDECVALSPGTSQESLPRQSLLFQHFRETYGGEKCFKLLQKFRADSFRYRELIALFFDTLSLGFYGKYRLQNNGVNEQRQLRIELSKILFPSQNGHIVTPTAQSKVPAASRIAKSIPLWLPPLLSFSVLLAAWMVASFDLNKRSDKTFELVAALRTKQASPPPTNTLAKPASQASFPVVAHQYLGPWVSNKAITIVERDGKWMINLAGGNWFESGKAELSSAMEPALDDLTTLLKDINARVSITGHTDNVPIRTLKFPSNWHLSQARADEVRNHLNSARPNSVLLSRGLGSSQPIAPNDTLVNKAENRRVQIELESFTLPEN